MATIKLTKEQIKESLLNQKPISYFSDEMREILNKIDFTKIQSLNNSLTSVIQQFQNFNISQLTQNLKQVNSGFRKAINDIDFKSLENVFNEQNKQIKSFNLLFESQAYKELIRKEVIEHETKFHQWVERKKEEYGKYYLAMKDYYVDDRKILLPANFEEFFEFWTDTLPFRAYEYEVSRYDFIKFHWFIKEKLDEENQLYKLNFELSQKTTITKKLNYWLEIKDNFKDFFPQLTSLSIPESIYKKHFEPFSKQSEFIYWCNKYNAKVFFEESSFFEDNREKLNAYNALTYLKSELIILENYKKEVLIFLDNAILEKHEKSFTISEIKAKLNLNEDDIRGKYEFIQDYLDDEFKKLVKGNQENYFIRLSESQDFINGRDGFKFGEIDNLIKRREYIEYARIKSNYYEKHTLQFQDYQEGINFHPEPFFAKHVVYKEILEAKLKELEQSSPVTLLFKSNISATEKKEKPLLEIINEIPDRAKKAFEIYQIEFIRLNNSKQAKTNTIRQIFDAKEIYVCKNYENTRTQIGRDFKKYNLIPQKTTTRKR